MGEYSYLEIVWSFISCFHDLLGGFRGVLNLWPAISQYWGMTILLLGVLSHALWRRSFPNQADGNRFLALYGSGTFFSNPFGLFLTLVLGSFLTCMCFSLLCWLLEGDPLPVSRVLSLYCSSILSFVNFRCFGFLELQTQSPYSVLTLLTQSSHSVCQSYAWILFPHSQREYKQGALIVFTSFVCFLKGS